jgi:predicted alpha/beta-fold hydrolase
MNETLSAAMDAATIPPSAATFAPPGWLANPHVQSVLPSLKLRRPLLARRAKRLLACSEEHVLDCGEGVRLLGHYSSQQAAGNAPSRDLAVLLHGWEGNADSLYVLSLGSHLFSLGCDVFRLNFRDHGPTHHLNREIFHSCRIAEVVGAVHAIQKMLPDKRITVGGFSLGGNFALRIAARAPTAGIKLDRAVAISPVLRPHSTMEVLENGWFVYQQYFIGKWKRSLRIKQQLFPETYDFASILSRRNIREMTEDLVQRYSEFAGLDAYLNGYAITGGALAQLEVPSHIFAALDDPIIPAADLKDLPRNPHLQVTAVAKGGHCGFMDRLNSPSWADRRVAQLMGLANDS